MSAQPSTARTLRDRIIDHIVHLYRYDKEYSRYATRSYMKLMDDSDLGKDVKEKLNQLGLL